MMRLFIAVWTPDEVLDSLPLPVLTEKLDRQGVRFTRRDRIHLTLRFLGNVMDEDLDRLVSSLTENLTGLTAPELTVAGIGAFPHLQRPGVIWAGVQGDLDALHQRVLEASEDVAERPDDAKFQPHLTLARVSPPSQKVGRALDPLVREFSDQVFAKWRAEEVVLVQTMPDGSYEHRARFPLSGESA